MTHAELEALLARLEGFRDMIEDAEDDPHEYTVLKAMNEAIVAIRALTTWRPMETAPRDGTMFLALWGRSPIVLSWDREKVDEAGDCFPWLLACDCDGIYVQRDALVGWLPLPAPEVPK